MSSIRRLATVLSSTALAVGAVVAVANPAAAADPNFTFAYHSAGGGSFSIVVYNNGREAGLAYFQADPSAGATPGDAINATDRLEDGWGIRAVMVSLSTAKPPPAGIPLSTPLLGLLATLRKAPRSRCTRVQPRAAPLIAP